MSRSRTDEEQQASLWNGGAGRGWVEAQELLDGLFGPLEQLLAEAVAARPASRVLDVGCGSGATTVAAARTLGAGGACSGVDVSAPLIAAARERAEREGSSASFVLADAGTHAFDPGSFDLLVSRFGVMFFPDPVAAFANLRRAAGGGAEMRFVVWRDREENPFMTAAERAAAPLLADLPPRRPGGPGQFALADRAETAAVLTDAGWSAVDVRPLDVPCSMPESDLVPYLTSLGPVGRALGELDDGARHEVIERIRPAFDPYVHGGEVRFTAACWMLAARAS